MRQQDVIKTADWVIDLGPGGGVNGGEIVVEGTPEKVAAEAKSFTGQYLAPLLARTPVIPAKAGTQSSDPKTRSSRAGRRPKDNSREADADQPDLIAAK